MHWIELKHVARYNGTADWKAQTPFPVGADKKNVELEK